MTSPLPESLWTRRQVAEYLHIGIDTVDNYCKRGLLPFVRIPAGKRFEPEAVRRFLDSRSFNHQSKDKPRTSERQSNYVA